MDVIKEVTDIITQIGYARGKEDWEEIISKGPISNFKKDIKKYPKISHLFKNDDIDSIPDEIDIDNLSTVTEKILFAALWKNGDLLKVSHIINGLKNKKRTSDTAVTFHQFGQFLAQPAQNPIIDQHVIRAFIAVNETTLTMATLMEIAKSGPLLAKHHTAVIRDYVNWVKGKHDTSLDCTPDELFYAIDDVMFAFGRWIKSFSKLKSQENTEE